MKRDDERMTKTQTTKGTSLAKGPVGLLGLALLGYGITALIFGGHSFTQHAPTGAVHGKTWLGLEVNGWSGLLFIAAGLLLLLGAPLHWGAKAMSLIVGIALGGVCLIGLANGHGALGLFATNGLTELVLGASGVLLIIVSLLPRVGGKAKHRGERAEPARTTRRVEREPRTVRRNPTRDRTPTVDRQRLPAHGTSEGNRTTQVPDSSYQTYDTTAESH